jgi:hypothetical protein
MPTASSHQVSDLTLWIQQHKARVLRTKHQTKTPLLSCPECPYSGDHECFNYHKKDCSKQSARNRWVGHMLKKEHVLNCSDLKEYWGAGRMRWGVYVPGNYLEKGSRQFVHVVLRTANASCELINRSHDWRRDFDQCRMRLIPVSGDDTHLRVVFESDPGVKLPRILRSHTTLKFGGFHARLKRYS